ncbi:hypothetical protein CbuD7D7780_04415 [Coxiella burnetii]|uniref:Uncharacterized protein n=1 Tax=Coxiella burnetii (strain Dugway 5J108-111) TaxID=434922 RepID=A9KFE7_COXBN|nr:hypothetical protein [Coxiella burnetii]ABS76517.1 hypothetical protein CBUD_0856 [Coxiella burnetii Dugway 5J108-111]OYK80348.1 hypothetical protein CbuD7E6568_04395 [Coxiella burnetii]OYK82468.1 hypothetical protein CbuD7D7780_04415 [Coxiella burnetii]
MKTNELVGKIYKKLESTNRKFSAAVKNKKPRGSDLFKGLRDAYEAICNDIKLINRPEGRTDELLHAYFLEAWLGKLQTEENYLSESPENENTLSENDKKLEEIAKSLEALFLEANGFYSSIKSKKTGSQLYSKFLNDCEYIYNQIKDHHNSWKIISNQTKANYYYNFSEDLIKESKKRGSDEKAFLLKCVLYLKPCISFYNEAEDQASKKEVEALKEVNDRIEQLNANQIRKRKSPPVSLTNKDVALKKRADEKTNEPLLFSTNPILQDETISTSQLESCESNDLNTAEIETKEVAATAINLPNSTPELKNTGDETAHCDYRKEQPSVSNPPSLSTFRSGTFFHANLNSNSSNPTNEERTSECGKSHLLPKMRHKARFR